MVTSLVQDQLFDIDSLDTWPDILNVFATDEADHVEPATVVTELDLSIDAERRVRELLGGYELVALHATRLLPHERDVIRSQGLRAFGRTLFEDRINAAYEHGALSASEHDALLKAHMYAVGEENKRGLREGQVCLLLGSAALAHRVHSVGPLLRHWGGEGIYHSSGAEDIQPLLRRLGTPTIVQVAVPLEERGSAQYINPDIAKLLVGKRLGMPDADGTLKHPAPIAASGILGIWEPGDLAYDAFPELPRR